MYKSKLHSLSSIHMHTNKREIIYKNVYKIYKSIEKTTALLEYVWTGQQNYLMCPNTVEKQWFVLSGHNY